MVAAAQGPELQPRLHDILPDGVRFPDRYRFARVTPVGRAQRFALVSPSGMTPRESTALTMSPPST